MTSRDWLLVGCQAGHKWRAIGGRACEVASLHPERCSKDYPSQPVYECELCGVVDYGYRGGPGFADCEACQRLAQ